MIFQGVVGALMVMFGFCCVIFLPLGDALTLLFSAPLSTMILAAIFLGHRLRMFKVIFGILLLIGTVLVIQPEFLFPQSDKGTKHLSRWLFPFMPKLFREGSKKMLEDQKQKYYIGVALALGSAIADGFVNVAINFCQGVESLVLLWWTGISGFFISIIAYSFDPNARMFGSLVNEITSTEWIAYFMIAFSGIMAYYCMTKSLQMIDPTVVAFIRSLEIILAYIVQFSVIGDEPNVLSLIGAGLVLICVSAMTVQECLVSFVPEKYKFLF